MAAATPLGVKIIGMHDIPTRKYMKSEATKATTLRPQAAELTKKTGITNLATFDDDDAVCLFVAVWWFSSSSLFLGPRGRWGASPEPPPGNRPLSPAASAPLLATTSFGLRKRRRGGGSDAATLASGCLGRATGDPAAQPLGVLHSRTWSDPSPSGEPSGDPPASTAALEAFRLCAIRARSSPRSRLRAARRVCATGTSSGGHLASVKQS